MPMEGSFKTAKKYKDTRVLLGDDLERAEPMPGIVVEVYPDATIDVYVVSMDPLDVDERGRRRMKLIEGVPPFDRLTVDRSAGVTGTPARCYLEIG